MRLPEPAPVCTRPSWAPWLAVGSVCVGAFMGQLDASIASLALPAVGRAFDRPTAQVQWVALSYLLTLVVLVAPVGRASDRLGRKAVYLTGFAVFTAASVACALSGTLLWLVAARVVQGVGAAMLQANSVALVRTSVELPQVRTALGVQAGAQAAGLALGPAVGGLLLALGGWQLLFWVNVPSGLVGLVAGWLFLPRSASPRAAAGHEPTLLRRRDFRTPLGAGLLAYGAFFGVLYAVPLWLHAVAGMGPARIGLQLAILPLGLVLVAPFAGRLAAAFGAHRVAAVGLALCTVALGALALSTPTGAGLSATLFLTGLGLGLFTPANNATLMLRAPAASAGQASGLINLTRGLGTAAGVAVAGTAATVWGQPDAVRISALGLAVATGLALGLGGHGD